MQYARDNADLNPYDDRRAAALAAEAEAIAADDNRVLQAMRERNLTRDELENELFELRMALVAADYLLNHPRMAEAATALATDNALMRGSRAALADLCAYRGLAAVARQETDRLQHRIAAAAEAALTARH